MSIDHHSPSHPAPRGPAKGKPLVLATLTLLGGLAFSSIAQAQAFIRPFYFGGTWSGPLVAPVPEGPRRLPLDALYEEIADQGYRPLGVVGRTRDSITVDAVDASNRRMRLTVDAFDGEILARRPLTTARAEPQNRNIRPIPQSAPRQGATGTVPGEEATAPAPPRRKTVQAAPKAAPATPSAQGLNPAAPRTAPVAPARDPSQWGKEG